ncbi:hypothetical protein [Devosia nitrariae]|uniref:TIGR02588 family protein n=1 Tax=Devosia nitrariae TaxID=2071872 RepID=A0ABQ5VZ38_9HYPH|nr:hypothetical protein [Devosia nitrariae]GLQ53064.1 TIGR02588 family protein [Devosia nitrariae]
MATSKTARKPSRSTSRRAANKTAEKVEWIVAGVATLVVVVLMGFLVYEAVTRSGGSPDLAVSHIESTRTRAGLAVLLEVDNAGHAAASAVEVVGRTGANGQEARVVTIDYVPAEARRRATLVFPPETRPEDVRLHVLGYADP